jgi:glutathione S-transferase
LHRLLDVSIVLYHHPHPCAAHAVWMLEELGVAYDLRSVDITRGARRPDLVALNPMGKLPILTDGETVVT